MTPSGPKMPPAGLLARLQRRGVLRVAASYLLIGWLILQIGDVTLEPVGAPSWVMRALIALVVAGFPVAILLAWFYELTPSGVQRDEAPESQARPTVGGVRRYADVAVIGVLALTVVFLLLKESGWLSRSETLRDASLAVLPFQNEGPDAADDYLATGFGDELRGQLARTPSLRVIAQASSEAIQAQSLAPMVAAAKLDVAVLVEGTVRREERKLRVTAQLIDGRNGSILWSEDYDRSTDDLLNVQTEIARAIVSAVLPKFVAEGGQVPATSTSVVSAQDLYLLGKQKERESTPEALAKAQELFEQATAADPGFAAAHAALGRVIAVRNGDMALSDPDGLERLVLPHLERALALDRALGEAYMVKGNLRRWELRPGGEEYYRLAAELDPNSSWAQSNVAAYQFSQNRPDLALDYVQRARQLDPLRFGPHEGVIGNLIKLGRSEEVPAAVSRMMDLFGQDVRGIKAACWAQGANGDHDRELACLVAALRQFPAAPELLDGASAACADIGDISCENTFLQHMADAGDEEAILWLQVNRGETAALAKKIEDALTGPVEYYQGFLLCQIALAVHLDELALKVFQAAGMESATTENAVLRSSAMELMPQIIALKLRADPTPEVHEQLDQVLEWTARPLAHGAKWYLFYLQRSFALAAAGRMDEAIAQIQAAMASFGAPFDDRLITDGPIGAILQADPRLAPLLQLNRDRQAKLRERLPATLQAAGLDLAELVTPNGPASQLQY